MKLRIHAKERIEIKVDPNKTLSGLLSDLNLKAKVVQVGGALGGLYRGNDLKNKLCDLKFYEPSLAIYNDFCPVDLARFMVRFVIRELNIVNDDLRELNQLIDDMTTGKASKRHFHNLLSVIEDKPLNLGIKLLYNNLKTLTSWYKEVFEDHISGRCSEGICRGLIEAQCINACPAGIHIPGFVALMKDRNYKDAYALMRQENPLSGVCGSVCARPCEDKCRRGEITGTVGVRALQRFISSQALKAEALNEDTLEDKEMSVAIIGGGPCGLTAAYFLKRAGYKVTVYEKHEEAGGMLSFGVPKYRLPSEQIRQEIDTIKSLGVEIKTDFEVDQEIFKTLQGQHDAVLVATGRQVGRVLDIDHERLVSGIDFLKAVHLEKSYQVGKKVVVIGGGDVAMDCARTARRLGSDVSLISLEKYEDLPASLEEKIQSQEEGVDFISGYGIDSVSGKELQLKSCLQVTNLEGVFDPKFGEERLSVYADVVICAIGQESDVALKGDDSTFYAGDLIRPTIVIDAIAQGKEAAKKIDTYLKGQGLYVGPEIKIPSKVLNIRTFDHDLRDITTLDVNKRLNNFEQVNLNYTLEDALYEADRCMRCDRNSTASLLLGR